MSEIDEILYEQREKSLNIIVSDDYMPIQKNAHRERLSRIEAAQRELAELLARREADRWIPVEERLPDAMVSREGIKRSTSDLVHVLPRLTMDRATWYDHDLEKWDCSAEVRVTHWRPLPDFPKEEK